MAAPVLQAHTMRRGALTLRDAGGVPLAQFMVVSGSGITSWAITPSGGTAGHWNLPTDGTSPTPTTAGNTADLNGGPYTFAVTATNADGTSAPATLTINIAADTYTISSDAQASGSSASTAIRPSRASLGGKVIELARGSEARWQTDVSLTLQGFNTHAAGTYFTVQSEDANNQTTIRRLSLVGVQRAIFQDFLREMTLPADNTNDNLQTGQTGRSINVTGTSAGSQGASGDLTFRRLIGGAASGTTTNQWPTGISIAGSSTEKIRGITIESCKFYRVADAISLSDVEDVTITSPVVDHFCVNAFKCFGNFNNINVSDELYVRPCINAIAPGVHKDFGQWGSVNTSENVGNVTVLRGTYLICSPATGALTPIDGTQNEGTVCAQGSPFCNDISRYNTSGLTMNNVTIRGTFSDTAATNAMILEAGAGWDVRFVTNARGPANFAEFPSTAGFGTVLATTSGIVQGCVFHELRAAESSPLIDFPDLADDNTIMNDEVTPPATWTEAARVTFLSQFFQDPGRLVDYKSLTAEEILAEVREMYSAVEGGRLMNVNGTYRGRWFPDGTENDGSVFQATPPSAITSSTPTGTAEVGAPVVVTFQLDAAANQDVTIDPAVAGVTGSFSSDPVVIATGDASGTTTFTATSAGTAAITATDDRGLTDPATLNVTITAPAVTPTSYTLAASPSVAVLLNAISLLATLDAPATADVTVTMACAQAGSFTSGASVVIPNGQTTGVVTFVPTAPGTYTFTSTNDRSLSNPAAVNVTVIRTTVGILVRLGMR